MCKKQHSLYTTNYNLLEFAFCSCINFGICVEDGFPIVGLDETLLRICVDALSVKFLSALPFEGGGCPLEETANAGNGVSFSFFNFAELSKIRLLRMQENSEAK